MRCTCEHTLPLMAHTGPWLTVTLSDASNSQSATDTFQAFPVPPLRDDRQVSFAALFGLRSVALPGGGPGQWGLEDLHTGLRAISSF